MALQLSGLISMQDIEVEMGYAVGTLIDLRLQKPASIKQVWIGGAWANLNMCSSYLPTHTAPFQVKDWYGYNHTAGGIVSVSISGNTNLVAAQNSTFTANLNGTNFTGATYVWEKYDTGNGNWSTLGTSSTQTTSWVTPATGIIKVTVSGGCQGGTVSTEQGITLACTVPSNVVIIGATQLYALAQVQYTLSSFLGSTDGVSYSWSINGSTKASISSGGSSNTVTIQFLFDDAYSSQSVNITCTVTNPCGNSTSNTINVTPYVFSNTSENRNYTKNNCSDAGTGSNVSVNIAANTVKAYDTGTLAGLVNNWFNSNGQNNANSSGSCTWYNDTKYYYICANNRLGDTLCGKYKYEHNCEYYTVKQNSYSSTSSKAAANALADADADSNQQSWANSNLGYYQNVFGNVEKTASAFKNNCSSCNDANNVYSPHGTQRVYTIPANTYCKSIGEGGQTQADTEAQNQANDGAQANANTYPCNTDCYISASSYANNNTVYADATTNNAYCSTNYTGCNVRFYVYPNTVFASTQALANTAAQTKANTDAQTNANTYPCCTLTNNDSPTSLIATTTKNYKVELRWTDNSPIETGFQIEYSENNSSWSVLGTQAQNSTFFDYNFLTGNKLYYFRVKGLGTSNSDYTNTASIITCPEQISSLYALATGSIFQLFVSGTEPTQGTASTLTYEFQGVKPDGSPSCMSNYFFTLGTSSNLSFVIYNCVPNSPADAEYYSFLYRIRARVINGNGVASNWSQEAFGYPTTGTGNYSSGGINCSYWAN